MGIALLSFSSLFAGLAALQRLASPAVQVPPQRAVHAPRLVRPTNVRPRITARPVSSISAPRPAGLRVVRVCDARPSPGDVGRMVISGRMADVCAELDRLAAHEAGRTSR